MADDESEFSRNPTGWIGSFYMLWVTFSNWIFAFLPISARIMGAPRQQKEKDNTLAVGDADPANPNPICNINVLVKGAKRLPKMDLSGKADPYVLVRLGAKEKKTATIKKTLDPTWNESMMLEAKQNSTANIVFEVMDWDNVGRDELIGRVHVPVQDIISQQRIERDYEILHENKETVINGNGEAALLRLSLSYSAEQTSGEAEWLNRVILKAYRVMKDKVNKTVKDTLNETFSGLGLPVIGLELASCSIGESAPWLMGLELLPTRSDQDIQVLSTLRWVADGDFHVKVLAKAGPVSVSVAVSDVEIQFPAWIQVRLQTKDPNASAMSALQVAATEEPTLRFSISFGGVSTAAIPGVETAIDYGLRMALKKALCLPAKLPKLEDPSVLNLELSPEQRSAVGRLSVKFYEGDALKMPATMGVLSGVVEAVGTVDPFIVAEFQSAKAKPQTKRTKTISNTQRPKWNEFAEFMVHDEEADKLLVKVLDEGPVDSGAMGQVELKIAELVGQQGWTESWYELTGKDVRQGKVRMAVEYARFSPDDGPKVEVPEPEHGDVPVEDVTLKPPADGERAAAAPPPPEEKKEPPQIGKMLIRIISAHNLPSFDIGGKSDPYIVVSSPITGAPKSKDAFTKRKTKTVQGSLNPVWEEEFTYMESMAEENREKLITLHVKDADQFGTDEWMGKVVLKLQDIMDAKEDGKELTMDITGKGGVPLVDGSKKQSQLKLFYSFSEEAHEAATDVGAEWLNGTLRKGFRLFGRTIDEQVSASLKATLEGLEVPGIKKFELREFSVGSESPWIMEIKTLNSRSDQDIQLMCRLRWVCDSTMVLKIHVETSAGISLNVTASNLELEFPAWIQAKIQNGLEKGAAEAWAKAKEEMREAYEKKKAEAKEGEEVPWVEPATDPPVLTAYKVAAVEEAVLKFKLSLGGMSFGAIPGLEDTLDSNIRSAVHNALVLPSGIAATTVDVEHALSDLEQQAVGRLSIKVFEAEGLVDPDAWGSCDPFVGVTVLSGKSSDKQKKKTKTVYNTTAPRWNSFLEVLVLDEGADKVRLEVLDEDLYKTDALGSVTLAVREMSAVSGWVERWHPLEKGSGARLRLACSYEKLVPDEGPPPPPAPKKKDGPKVKQERAAAAPDADGVSGKLTVSVSKASNLPKMDFWGAADPYVELRHGIEEAKTKVIKGELNPQWNESFTLEVRGQKADLILTLKDWEKVGKNETMGFARVPWAELEASTGDEMELAILSKDGERLVDKHDKESRVFVSVQLQLDV